MGTTGPFARRTVPGGGDASPVPRTDLDVALGANASEMPRRFGLQLWEESAACSRAVPRFPPCSPSPDHAEARAQARCSTPRQSRDIGAAVDVAALLPDRMDNLPASAGSWSRSVGVAAAAARNLRLCR